ncbi:ATP-binding cassette sub-family C member 10-like [Branchiostoma lanceolatum]|uniref:ATP-binding cassette sub-family C member 10-like n=1 Tax=Branchiostoma lanceolatum TaxID=7740 RepID=UPI003455F58E
MTGVTLGQFCGTPNDTVPLWWEGHLGHCFQQVAVVLGTHFIFAVCSAYFAGIKHGRIIHNLTSSAAVNIRLLISALQFCAPLLHILLVELWQGKKLPLVDVVTDAFVSFSWLVHTCAVSQVRKMHVVHMRGPLVLALTWALTLVATGFQLQAVILRASRVDQTLDIVTESITFAVGGLQFVYLVTLVPSHRPNVPLLFAPPHVQSVNEEEESLLQSGVKVRYDGTVYRPDTVELDIAEDNSNWLSKLTFWWVNPLMVKGSHMQLNATDDLFHLPRKLTTTHVENVFTEKFYPHSTDKLEPSDDACPEVKVRNGGMEVQDVLEEPSCPDGTRKSLGQPVTLMKGLNGAFGVQYYSLGILKLLGDGLGFAGPLLLNLLVSFMENSNEPMLHGYLYALGLFSSTLIGAILSSQFNYQINKVGIQIRAALVTTVYHKALAVSSTSLSGFTTGEVVNFMSTDTGRIVNFCPSFHQFWSLPFQIAVSLYLLHQQVGISFLAGLAFALLLIPINRWLAIKIGKLSNDMMLQKDARVKLMNEILYGIRVIKFYAWESTFQEKVRRLRQLELKSLRGRKYLDALCVYFWATTPVLISILTFTTYSALGNKLTAAKVFTSVALFNMLISPLNAFPWVINGLMEAWVSVKRLQAFLQLREIDLHSYYSAEKREEDSAVEIRNGCFSWSSADVPVPAAGGSSAPVTQEDPGVEDSSGSSIFSNCGTQKLEGISLTVQKGQLVGVIGAVGSGKSSLLAAITAEMERQDGEISVANLTEGFGLAAQEAWIQQSTVRDNILFGKEMDADIYERVIWACALGEDLKILPSGDRTEVGENGVTLSGGQKARLSLARAVYQGKDIYLLDDPLAAVDAHVAEHIFSQCIMELLKDKTRILCTHHTRFLQEADLVVVMEAGRIVKTGPPSEVLNHDMKMPLLEKQEKRQDNSNDDEEDSSQEEELTPEPALSPEQSLVQEEEREVGSVAFQVYRSYWQAVGACLAPSVLVALFLMQASKNLNDWWLSYWISHSHHNDTVSPTHPALAVTSSQPSSMTPLLLGTSNSATDDITFYLTVYGALAGANTVFTLFRAFLFAYGGICAARVLHDQLINSILKAKIQFFDTTPIGRVVNRFSSDMYSIDDSLPFIMNILLAQTYGVVGTIVVTCYGLPWFTVLLLPLAFIYHRIQKYYRHTSRELKRLDSVSLSPIYAHFSETLTGLTTIRGLRAVQRFKHENQSRLECNQRASFSGQVASSWLGIRLQLLGVAMVTGVAFIAVLEHHFQTVDPGLVGLAISYALSVTNLLSGVVTSFTETEKQMVSVERAVQYVKNIPWERTEGVLEVSRRWPEHGAVTWQGVNLTYRQGLPKALDNVTFSINPGEKVGVVGRTGAGKSSLLLCLFRMTDIQSGTIKIDDVDIRLVELQRLRSRLAVIPQDPFLFGGTVRENLDPRDVYSNTDLWNILEKCHLKPTVQKLGGLEAEVGEKGKVFSAGQRQLMCLARAILTRAKVLCIDEATANVDHETDQLIQQTIRTEFVRSTVITIAHRTNTIMDSERVLVMSAGRVVEFASPQELLADPTSIFYGLVHKNR